MKPSIKEDDLLFHSAHGLCRVAQVMPSTSAQETSYALLPVSLNRAKARFVIPETMVEESGFCKLVSDKDAEAILDYLKTGKRKEDKDGQAWKLAEFIRSGAADMEPVKDGRKRNEFDRAAKGLSGVLAFIFKTTISEMGIRIQKQLGSVDQTNPAVVAALAKVDRQ